MNDAGLRRCSKGARGVWIDLLCLMHQGQPYGYLAGTGGKHPVSFLARWCGETERSFSSSMIELTANGVYSLTDDGVIYSRRMVRDEHNRQVRGAGGSKSALNPNVPRSKGILPTRTEGILRTGEGEGEGISFFENQRTETKTVSRAQEKKPGAVSTSFRAFWDRWCLLTGRKQRESYACQAWVSVVEFETEAAALACLERYGMSDECKRGIVTNADKWLYEQARDGWRGEWQARAPVVNGIVSEMERYLDEH